MNLRTPIAAPARAGLPVRPAVPVVAALARVVLWLLVAAGALGGVTAALRPAAGAVPAAAAGATDVPPEVVGFAEIAARQWLTRAGEETPDLAITGAAVQDTRGVVAGGTSIAIAARPVSAGYWAVTVAVELAGVAPGLWFLEVGVVRDSEDRLGLSATPALVPGPQPAEAPALAGPLWRVPAPDDPVTDAVARFAEALLTGAGDVSRYLAPSVELRAIDPAPFVATSVARLASEPVGASDVRARVLIEGRTGSGSVVFVAYELLLRQRAGRWEIARVSGAPALSERRVPAALTTTSTTTTAPAVPGA